LERLKAPALRQLLILSLVVFFIMFPRLLFAPLLEPIREDLVLSKAEATRFFLFISLGYTVSILLSGFVSKRITHRYTILIALLGVGTSIAAISFFRTPLLIYAALTFCGLSTGLYPPSGLSSVTGLVPRKQSGTAIAIHELGPNFAFFFAPFIAGILLGPLNWRSLLLLSGLSCYIMAGIFFTFSKAGKFSGEPPKARNILPIVREPSFWAAVCLMVLSVAASQGIFSILPTFLNTERNLELSLVNRLIGLSRISGLAVVLISGYLGDKFGIAKLALILCIFSAVFTILLGVSEGFLLILSVFMQPMLIMAFFPLNMSVVSQTGPRYSRNIAISIAIPIAFLLGSGVYPIIMGNLAEQGKFSLGFIILGIALLVSLFILPFLNIRQKED